MIKLYKQINQVESVHSPIDRKMDMKLNSIMASILVLVTSVLVMKVVKWVWLRPKKLEKFLRMQGIQGNSYRLLIGDLIDFFTCVKTEQPKTIAFSDDLSSHILPYHHNIIHKYGKLSLIWFGTTPTVNIADPELMKEILSKPGVFHKPSTQAFGLASTGGLFFAEDEKWEMERKLINPTFHLEKLKKMIPEMYLSCSSMVGKWEALFSSSKKLEIDVWPYIEKLAGDVISRTLFGSSHEEGKRIFELIAQSNKLVLQMVKYRFIPGWSYFPHKTNRRRIEVVGEIKSVVRDIINQRKRKMENGEIVKDNLLGTLMTGLSIEDIIEDCRVFYFAGSETSANMMVWTMVMLSKYKEWQRRAREEVVKVFGNEEPTLDGLNQLKTLTMILHEVLRMYPPVPLTLREATKKVKVGNIMLPKGTQLTLLIGLQHHDPEIWGDDVNQFRPDRFSQGISNAAKAPFSFVPFISGPRVCIGQNFAMIEVKLALMMILQRFSFELSPSYRHAPFPILTLQPQYGAPIILHKL